MNNFTLHSLTGLAWRNLRQDRLRTILSVAAVGLGVSMIIAVDAISNAVSSAMLVEANGQSLGDSIIKLSGSALSFVGLIILAAAGFLVFNSFAMSVARRRQQIGTLRSLGMTSRQIQRLMLIEALMIGGLGAVIGLIVGPILGSVLILFAKTVAGNFIPVGNGAASFGAMLRGIVLGIVITVVAMLLPARAAMRVSPITALREQIGSVEANSSRLPAIIAGCALILLVLYLIIAPPGTWVQAPVDGFLALGFILLWLVALVIVLPSIIGALGRLFAPLLSRQWGTVGRLIADNFQRDRRRVTITVLTMAIGLTMIVSLTGIDNFLLRDLVLKSMARLQNAYIALPFDFGGTGVKDLQTMRIQDLQIPPDALRSLHAVTQGRAHALDLTIVLVPELSFLMPGLQSYVVDPDALKEANVLFNFTQGSWDQALPIMHAGCGLLVAPQVAHLNNAGIGDVIMVTGSHGKVPCTVAGIGNNLLAGISFISRAAADQFDAKNTGGLIIIGLPGVDPAQFEADINAAMKPYPGTFIIGIEATMNTFQGFISAGLLMINAVMLLAVLAAALGIINTTVSSLIERRHELGLLRAVGATRSQVRAVVTGEAALMGLVGALFGLAAGVGVVLIFVVTYGSNSFGITDFPLWPAAFSNAQPSAINGLVGVILAPIIAALAARYPANAILKGPAIETLQPPAEVDSKDAPRWWMRGSIRTRFVIGTVTLLTVVVMSLVSVITTHISASLDDTVRSVLQVATHSIGGLIELAAPPDAQTLRLDMLQSGSFKNIDVTSFSDLSKKLQSFGLAEAVIADDSDTVLVSTESAQIGKLLVSPVTGDDIQATIENASQGRKIILSMPLHNNSGKRIGTVRIAAWLTQFDEFANELRNLLLGIGLVLIVIGGIVSYVLATPLVTTTSRLAENAARVGQGNYDKLLVRSSRWDLSVRTRLTLALVGMVIVTVLVMGLITVPLLRDRAPIVTTNFLLKADSAYSSIFTQVFQIAQKANMLDTTSLPDFKSLTSDLKLPDLAKLQTLLDESRSPDMAYFTLYDKGGTVIVSDQLALIGKHVNVADKSRVDNGTWRGDNIWIGSAPLYIDPAQPADGGFQFAVRKNRYEALVNDAGNLFQAGGLIAILAGILVAQSIGGLVTAPVQQLVDGTQQVARGDLNVHFRVNSRDELSALAEAYNQMMVGLREREWLQDMFGRFVSREVADAIRSGQVRLEGENRVVSVLFCDIRDFTGRSEKNTPEEMVALLNEYLPVVVGAAQQYSGTVNKFGGDSTLVIYGAPRLLEESAYQALCTALAIRDNLTQLNDRLALQGIDPIHIGVGINTGTVLAGAVGTPERQEYTVIGDTVNLASRIESLNKDYPDYGILISDLSHQALGKRAREFDFVDLGSLEIRGKAQPTRIWAVVGFKNTG